MVNVFSPAHLSRILQEGPAARDLLLQGLDLRDLPPGTLSRLGAGVLLGCALRPEQVVEALAGGAVIFPPLKDLPYDPYRSSLYSLEELMEGYVRGSPETFHTGTLDSRIYRHFSQYREVLGSGPVLEALAQRLHDHAMDEALFHLLFGAPQGAPAPGGGKKVVGIMGGHALQRDDPAWARVARIGFDLARAGYLVATGGGPGAMEAGNLGAWLAPHGPQALEEAVSALSRIPSWKDPLWFESAWAVRDRFPEGGESVAVPTWYYGHEPSNLFSRHVAKYFSNSIREDVLVSIAVHGILFTPGSAGTIQEVFADATQNHYGTVRYVSPMVFLDTDFWTRQLPVIPLLERLSSYRRYQSMVTLADDADSVLAFLQSHTPVPFSG